MNVKRKNTDLSDREETLRMRGDFATLAAWAFMAVPWAGEGAFLVGLFLLGLSLGCQYYLMRIEERVR